MLYHLQNKAKRYNSREWPIQSHRECRLARESTSWPTVGQLATLVHLMFTCVVALLVYTKRRVFPSSAGTQNNYSEIWNCCLSTVVTCELIVISDTTSFITVNSTSHIQIFYGGKQTIGDAGSIVTSMFSLLQYSFIFLPRYLRLNTDPM